MLALVFCLALGAEPQEYIVLESQSKPVVVKVGTLLTVKLHNRATATWANTGKDVLTEVDPAPVRFEGMRCKHDWRLYRFRVKEVGVELLYFELLYKKGGSLAKHLTIRVESH